MNNTDKVYLIKWVGPFSYDELYNWEYNRENETYNFSKRNVQFSHFFAPCFTIV